MFRQKPIVLLLSVAILLVTLVFLQIPDDLFAGVSAQLDNAPSDSNEVEILILLKDRPDTRHVADQVRANLPSGASIAQEKAAVRRAVFESLKNKAEKTQAPLVKFLEAEKGKGKVSEVKSYYLVNLVYARVDENLAEKIARRPDVDSIWLNEEIELLDPAANFVIAETEESVEWNITHIGAPQVWDEIGFDGEGVVIGIIDTGVSWQHEALKDQYRGYDPTEPDSVQHAYNWLDLIEGQEQPLDNHGHGSHCAGTALGVDPDKLNQIGVAPGAKWIAARSLDDKGKGLSSDLLAAMEFMLAPTPNSDGTGEPNPDLAPDIVSNSWGSTNTDCDSIFLEAIENWRSAGILPVFSAGNSGSDDGTIAIPGDYAEAFAVGAVDSNNTLADFSSRGPSSCDAELWKPELTAPGVSIRSAYKNSATSYAISSGTSMAAPHVAGVAALLRSADPTLSVDQLEEILINSAFPLTDDRYPESPNYGYGYGLLDAYAAVNSLIDYTVTVSAYPSSGGNVSGGGLYNRGSEVVVEAVAGEGYLFVNWTEGGEVLSTDATYVFEAYANRDLVANFQPEQYDLSLWLNEGWNLLSLPRWLESVFLYESDIDALLVFRDGTWSSGEIESSLNNPAQAVFIKTYQPTELFFIWAELTPDSEFAGQILKPGWNLISCGLQADYSSILADLSYHEGNGLTQIFAPNSFNGRKEEGYSSTWDNPLRSLLLESDTMPPAQMYPYDGYWVYLAGEELNYSTPVTGYLQID